MSPVNPYQSPREASPARRFEHSGDAVAETIFSVVAVSAGLLVIGALTLLFSLVRVL